MKIFEEIFGKKKKEERINFDKVIAFVGENNVGKSTFSAILSKEFGVDVFDMDELKKLKRLYIKARDYYNGAKGILVFPREKQSFEIMLKINLDGIVVWTQPYKHIIDITREIINTIEYYEISKILGIVVNFAKDEKEAIEISKSLGYDLLEWFPYIKELDSISITGRIEDFKVNKKLRAKLFNLLKRIFA